MRTDYLDFLAQAGKLLNSTGNRLVKINLILTMLLEQFAIRNPILLVRDNVTGEYNIELAPELTEQESNTANHRLCEYIHRFPHRLSYELILFPEEAQTIPIVMPEQMIGEYSMFVSCPARGAANAAPLGIFLAFIQGNDKVKERIKLLNVIADMVGFFLAARETSPVEMHESVGKGIPMILEGIVGSSPAMKKIGEIIKKVSTSRASVFIRGESGAGKELIARAIHNSSLRSRAPFVGVNCAALPDTLLESELFGHEKGAFTGAVSAKKGRFELANGGTIFLDEIGDTSLAFQAKLLRVLQEGEIDRLGGAKTIKVDVRVICSTNVDVEEAIRDGTFREDLYYRLNVIPITAPSLRERREDIPWMVSFFLEKLNHEYGKSVKASKSGMRLMQELDWPGNVRELENFTHRAFVMERDGFLNIEAALHSARTSGGRVQAVRAAEGKASRKTAKNTHLENEEVQAIKSALMASKGVQTKAAKMLGISLRQLRYRIKKHDIVIRKIQL